ncbi:MAG: aminotransferase [Gaiellaceae bacterium]|jgi:alanine-synthesizing transaminase|nr:MAG: aminotransferase [Gaiellaceae bacterium]
MDLRRIPSLPPYVFAEIDRLKLELRRAGEDVVDLGFGNPDLASPEVAVEKLCEAARNPRNHRYSTSRGLPNLRAAICERYATRYGVELDPETEAIATMGAKEGFCHLFWVLVEPGDAVLVPSPSYPIHLFAPAFAGASLVRVPVAPAHELPSALEEAYERSTPRPRVLVLSFPHNPTTAVADLDLLRELVAFARERELLVVHDFAYADLSFDGYEPPSILQVDGAKEVAVELYSLTKGFSLAGWRVGFLLGNAEVVHALGRLKSYLDYGTFQPIQIAAITTLREAPEHPDAVSAVYRARRDALCEGLRRIGWPVAKPQATMFVWAEIPEPYRALSSLEFASLLARRARVAVSPGEGFGPGGKGHVRFALVENEQRIRQAVRGIDRELHLR